jgi:hypothetical protein
LEQTSGNLALLGGNNTGWSEQSGNLALLGGNRSGPPIMESKWVNNYES